MQEFTKRPKNNAEGQLYDILDADGCQLLHKGYPDFLCVKDNKIMCVEVKPSNQRLKRHQREVAKILTSCGIPYYKWTPQDGFTKINFD